MLGRDLVRNKHEILSRRIFIKKVPEYITEADISQYFSFFGQIDLTYVAKNFGNVDSELNIGFVNFLQHESVQLVLRQNTHVVRGYPLHCQAFKPKNEKNLIDKDLVKNQIGQTTSS